MSVQFEQECPKCAGTFRVPFELDAFACPHCKALLALDESLVVKLDTRRKWQAIRLLVLVAPLLIAFLIPQTVGLMAMLVFPAILWIWLICLIFKRFFKGL